MASARRPRSWSIVFTLILVQGIGVLVYGLYLAYLEGWLRRDPGTLPGRFLPFAFFKPVSYSLVLVLFALLALLLAISLHRTRWWAWTAAVSLQGINLLSALIEYLQQRPNYAGMLFGIVIVFYLNQSEVQEIFRGGRGEHHG